jgi:predicted transcriptional regulator
VLDLEERIIQILANLNAVRPEKALEVEAIKDNLKVENEAIRHIIRELKSKGYLMEEKEKIYLTMTGIIRAFSYYS